LKHHKDNMRAVQKRLFECTVCGSVAPATKRSGRTFPGHTKTMYCFTCKEETDHLQIE